MTSKIRFRELGQCQSIFTKMGGSGRGNLKTPLFSIMMFALVTGQARADLVLSILDTGSGTTRFVGSGETTVTSGTVNANNAWWLNISGAASNTYHWAGIDSGTWTYSINGTPIVAPVSNVTIDQGSFFGGHLGIMVTGGSLPTANTGDTLGWNGDIIINAPYSSFNPGTYTATLNQFNHGANTIADPVTISVGTLLSRGPTPEEIQTALSFGQLVTSAIPLNQAVGQVASGIHQIGSQGIGSRLYRVRGRTTGGDGIARVGGGFDRRGREVAASRLVRMERELNIHSTINLGGVNPGSPAALGDHLETATLSDEAPLLAVTRPAGGNLDPGCLASGENWMIFGSFNFGSVGLDNLGGNPGLDSYTYSWTVGAEYQVNEEVAIGAGWSHIWNDNTLAGGLGSVDMEGDAAMVYGTYFKNNFWSDLLYSYGSYEADIRRNTLGGTSRGTPDLDAHQVALNLGYNIEADLASTPLADLLDHSTRIVHGPTLAIDYSTGTLARYTETGNALSDTTFAAQDYESLVTTVGWQVTGNRETWWGHLRPQVRLGYGRENLDQNTSVTGTLAGNPLISATRTTISPGDHWMEVGGGAALDFNSSNFGLFLNYTGQYFREDAEVHYASLKAQMPF